MLPQVGIEPGPLNMCCLGDLLFMHHLIFGLR